MTSYHGRIITYDSSGNLKDFVGYITVKDGIIKRVSKDKPLGEIVEYEDNIILPGFIDTHIHLPQIGIRGKWSSNLLKWLETYVFPEEKRFLDSQYAEKMANWFFEELAKNGTTTALVFGPPNKESTEVAFDAAKRWKLRIFMGQTLMDQNVPEELITPVNRAVKDVKYMIKKYGKSYALTLRFAPACTMELMKKTSEIARFHKIIIQTHISEQVEEVKLVKKMFNNDYAKVYDLAGALYSKTVLAHGIHLNDVELKLINSRGSMISHCPSSNFFLHSGIMNINKMQRAGIEISLGSDIAGGAYINMLEVMRDAYYANPLSPSEILKILTVGGARTLHISDITGTIETGKYADFVVLDSPNEESTEDALANLILYGNQRKIIATYSQGEEIWHR